MPNHSFMIKFLSFTFIDNLQSELANSVHHHAQESQALHCQLITNTLD